MGSSAPTPRQAPIVRLADGRVALVHDGSRIALAAAMHGGGDVSITLFAPMARSWAERVARILDELPPTRDVTPVELRTPWLRNDDGNPALAVGRVTRGLAVRWRLLVMGAAGERAIELAAGDVVELLRHLAAPPEAARDAG